MLLLCVLNQGNVSDSSMSALVLHRNASLCYIIIIRLLAYTRIGMYKVPDHDFVMTVFGKHLTTNS